RRAHRHRAHGPRSRRWIRRSSDRSRRTQRDWDRHGPVDRGLRHRNGCCDPLRVRVRRLRLRQPGGSLGRRNAPRSAAARVGGALLLACSATFVFHLIQPMSDVPVTAWWMLAAVLLFRGTDRSAFLAGLACSAAILTRPNLVPLVLVFVPFLRDPKRVALQVT